MRFSIMRDVPAVFTPDGEELKVPGNPGRILRLLLLARGHALTKNDLALELGGIRPTLRLRNSRVEPRECIEQTVQRLWFHGIFASKWVTDLQVRNPTEDFTVSERGTRGVSSRQAEPAASSG